MPKPLPPQKLTTKTIKSTLVVQGFENLLDVDTVGQQFVPIHVHVFGRDLTAKLNPKTFRKAQQAYKDTLASVGGASVVIQAELNLDKMSLESAGVLVQPKPPKDGKPASATPPAEAAPKEPETPPPPPAPAAEPPAQDGPVVIIKKRRTIEKPEEES